jgi:Na+-translocating ferredoxin:NAD+ oxidoreductase subunit D
MRGVGEGEGRKMSEKKMLYVSLPPHSYSGATISSLMYSVAAALTPALAASVYVYGLDALRVVLAAVASCVAFEYAIQKWVLKSEPTALDGSAIVTGILLAFNLPSGIPTWIVALGCFVAIAVAKMSFGGLGNNLFNPALVGRAFLLVSFPVAMTSWPVPRRGAALTDALTSATPLGLLKEGLKSGAPLDGLSTQAPSLLDLVFSFKGGCIGEASVAALLLGLAFLLWRKVVDWRIPTITVLTVAAATSAFWLVDPARYANPLFHLASGGLILGAAFMATDYATSPMTGKGMIVFAAGIGAITALIRLFGSYPEGMSFAILIMNAFVPLINRYCKPRRFGESRWR